MAKSKEMEKPAETAETTEATTEVLSPAELKGKADVITTRRTLYAAGAGLIPFPVLDVATVFGIQVYMIRDIANVYGVDFKEERTRALVTSLIGDLATLGVVSGIKAIPIVGGMIGAFTSVVAGAAVTYALGKVFTQHFDQGGTLLNFDPVESRKYFQEAYEEGKLFVQDLGKTDEENGKEKKSWREKLGLSASVDTAKEVEVLRQENEKMQAMIAELQKTVNDLKKA